MELKQDTQEVWKNETMSFQGKREKGGLTIQRQCIWENGETGGTIR